MTRGEEDAEEDRKVAQGRKRVERARGDAETQGREVEVEWI